MKMKKIGIICLTILLLSFKVNAQILHGINIDEIYNKSDWNSKGEIVAIVEDYGLMLNYQKDLENCSTSAQKISCLDKVAEETLKNLYINYEVNVKNYKSFRKSLEDNYAISTCQLKHFGPNGYLCNTDSMPDVYNALYNYIQTLILSSKESMQSLIPVLTEYKEAE